MKKTSNISTTDIDNTRHAARFPKRELTSLYLQLGLVAHAAERAAVADLRMFDRAGANERCEAE